MIVKYRGFQISVRRVKIGARKFRHDFSIVYLASDDARLLRQGSEPAAGTMRLVLEELKRDVDQFWVRRLRQETRFAERERRGFERRLSLSPLRRRELFLRIPPADEPYRKSLEFLFNVPESQ